MTGLCLLTDVKLRVFFGTNPSHAKTIVSENSDKKDMFMSTKKSIRFFNDRKVRAVWSDTDSKWYFSATDVVRAINNEEDYTKCRNYSWTGVRSTRKSTCEPCA